MESGREGRDDSGRSLLIRVRIHHPRTTGMRKKKLEGITGIIPGDWENGSSRSLSFFSPTPPSPEIKNLSSGNWRHSNWELEWGRYHATKLAQLIAATPQATLPAGWDKISPKFGSSLRKGKKACTGAMVRRGVKGYAACSWI